MRAEIAGKLPTHSPLGQDQREDTLTDAVFSALRYLPREVLRAWLGEVLPERCIPGLTDDALDSATFEFWPTLPGGCEPDVVITVGSLLIVIEAKYRSPFGGDGERPQLVVEWKQALLRAKRARLEGPVVIAVTAHATVPKEIADAVEQIEPDGELTAEESVRWCNWQAIAKAIEENQSNEWAPGLDAVVEDVFELMTKRKVRYMYEGFKQSDWWLLGAAADVATERVYPTIVEFAQELEEHGAPLGLVWGGGNTGVAWDSSRSRSIVEKWHRDYVELPVTHMDFGKRIKATNGLFVLFAFKHPAIRVGWWFQPVSGVGMPAQAAAIAEWLHALPEGVSVVRTNSWRSVGQPIDPESVNEELLTEIARDRSWLSIERSWSPEELKATGPVLKLLKELADSLLSDGAVLDALEADGAIDRSQAPDTDQLADASEDDEN